MKPNFKTAAVATEAQSRFSQARPLTAKMTAVTGSLTALLLLWHPLSVVQFVTGILIGVLCAVLGLKQMTSDRAVFPTSFLPLFVLLFGATMIADANEPESSALSLAHSQSLILAACGAVMLIFEKPVLRRFAKETAAETRRT